MIDVMAALLTARLDYVIANGVHNIALYCLVHNVLLTRTGYLYMHFVYLFTFSSIMFPLPSITSYCAPVFIVSSIIFPFTALWLKILR